ncbi:biorientation of chromosomes in cell division protein 1-like 1 [Chironomus tepperi]|uniref:biorientation of chromosomes in cell division protein 1-like 1 n=1 Tax=Chironomus tepperi TaxID=113505 RepID=UPI00391EF269
MAAYKLSDPEFVDKIILEVKSQGHFDTFRKECLADVDTQPAYQNLHSRVEDTVQRFLNRQVWTPEIKNKNRLREEMRMNIIRAGFLESGVSRIVDQVVEQKIDYIQSKVEEILYKYVGIEKPKKEEKQQNGTLEIDTALLPTDLEQVSPDSSTDKKSPGSIKEEIEEELVEDEDFESPAFEPIEAIKVEKTEIETCENTNLSEISGLTSQDSPKSHKSDPTNIEGEQNKVDTALSQISSTQDNIPDTSEMEPPIVTSVIPVPGICSEEAQMATGLNDSTENEVKQVESEKTSEAPKCQFDLKKDQIEFTGTERKSINLDDSTNSGESEKVVQPKDVQSMEVENLYGNDTTDSSEMRMEIDLKDETTQETAMSSKCVEESSQDSSKNKDKKSHKRDRSRDRSKSSSHKSSRRHHSSSSSKSKVDESSRNKSHSTAHKSSSSHKKSSEKDKDRPRERSSSSRKDPRDNRDNRDKDKKSESSKSSRSKQEEQKDDHHQEKSSSRRRRSTDHDSGDSLKDTKQSNNQTENKQVNGSTKGTENKATDQQQKSTENKSNNDEMESTKIQSNSNKEQKSSILVKYDYLKSSTKQSMDDDDMDSGFHGFEADQLPDNPWFECIDLMKSKKFPFVSNNNNNNYISKKNDSSVIKKTKSKSPDAATKLNDAEHNTTVHKSQFASQRYDANDLYKPKFDFSRRRRGQVVEDDANKSRDTAPASN